MKDTFMVYALAHTFLSQVIEGDELYTKINKGSSCVSGGCQVFVMCSRS
jgi:hypothetical protein